MFILIFILLFILNLIAILYVIFIEHKDYASTWAWVMVMVCLPFIGFMLYLFFGQSMRKRKIFSLKEEEDRYMHLLHSQLHQEVCLECFPTPVLNLHLLGHQVVYTTDNTFTLFTKGEDKFKDLFHAIRHAKQSIHLEYYIIHNDKLGTEFQNLLIEKAKEGLEVRLLYDGMGCFKTSHTYFQNLKANSVQIACFSPPFSPFINFRFNYRNHRKLCIIDEQIAYIGGFNVGDEYLGYTKERGFWRDTHIRFEGSGAKMANLQFLLDWRFVTKENTLLDHYIVPTLKPICKKEGALMQLVASGPDSKYSAIENGYIKMITEAKHSIWIQTPYFIPDLALFTALRLAALSGVDVRIMIPNKPDHLFVYWATYSYIGDLLLAGVKAYIYDRGFLHAKNIMIDERICSVGTANFDMRSFRLNFEINAFIYDESFTSQLCEAFLHDLDYCHELTLEAYKVRPYKIRFKESVARLFSPIL